MVGGNRCSDYQMIQPRPADKQNKQNRKGWGKTKRGKTQTQQYPHPPSTGASWQPTGLIRMVPIEVVNQRGIQDERTWHPGAFLRTIPLPIHQELQAPPPSPDIQQAVDSEGRVVIDEPGGWRGLGRRAQRTDRNWLELRNMKSGMDPHVVRQS